MENEIRLYYYSTEESKKESGVNIKIKNQIVSLNKSGINARLELHNSLNVEKCQKRQLPFFYSRVIRVHNALVIRCELKNLIQKLGKKDIIYFRRTSSIPLFYPLNYYKRFRKCVVVTEHQTKEYQEFKLNRHIVDMLGELFFGRIIKSQSDGFVGVTEEITEYELIHSKNPLKPNITIGNGFNVSSCPLRKPPQVTDHRIDLLCVANFNRWHGIDRIIKGLSEYQGNYELVLHLVGDGIELKNLKQMTVSLNLTSQVLFHGFKSGEKLNKIYNSCHIAIGSLGIHRIGLTAASTLKAREYCARGIPFIIACDDPDFPEDFPFLLRIHSDESPVIIDTVIKFTKEKIADLSHPAKMRGYAEEHLDWSIKMRTLKGFLETIVDTSTKES